MRYDRLIVNAVAGAIVAFIVYLVPVTFVAIFSPLVGGFVAGHLQGGGKPSAWAGLLSGVFLFLIHLRMIHFGWLLIWVSWYIGFSGLGGMLGGMRHERRGDAHDAFVR